MLEQRPCVRTEPAPFRPRPISGDVDERALRFELERQACHSLRQVLQLKLQQRRTREDLIKQGIMPSLKSSAAYHEQRRSLERARTEDYLKRKIRTRPERSELIRMHILEEASAEPSLQLKKLQLKKARLALNDKISQRPGPMELIHKNILPVHSSIKQAIETEFPKQASGDSSSFDVDSGDSLSPVGQESPAVTGPPPSPPDTESCVHSPAQDRPSAPRLPPLSRHRPSLKLTNGGATTPLAQRVGVACLIRSKPNSDRSAQRHKKPKDNQPKIRKLKYHQYVPPDQKGEKEPPPLLDSSYSKILQQQQLFLQLQILSQQQQQQQQQQHSFQAILPAPPKPEKNQQASSSTSMNTSSPPPPLAHPSSQGHSSAPVGGTNAASLPPNLDEMKVVELKSQLKLRSLPVSGTKTGLIERLKAYQELNGGGGGTTSSPTAGGNTGPGAGGAGGSAHISTSQQQEFQGCQASSPTSRPGDCRGFPSVTCNTSSPPAAAPQQLITRSSAVSPPLVSVSPSERPPATGSPQGSSFNTLEKMMRSALSQQSLQPCSAPQRLVNIKEEFPCSGPASCQFSKQSVSLQRPCPRPSAPPTAPPTAPVWTPDKDKMLQEKDKQIEELTRRLRQKQRLVELLRMQLECKNRGAQVPEPVVLLRVKQETPDKKPGVPLTSVHPPVPPHASSVSRDTDTKVTIKQEVLETDEVQSPNSLGLPRSSMQPEPQSKQELGDGLQPSALHLAQRHAVHRLLLQQQRNILNCNQAPENQQKLCVQKTKKSPKQQQILMRQRPKPLPQPPTKPPPQIQIHAKIHVKQQQVQQQAPKVCERHVKEQSGSALSLLPWSDSTPALVTDGDGNHFLITLSNHLTDAPKGKATNHIALQAEDRGHHVPVDRAQQGAARGLSPGLQPFLQKQEASPSGDDTSSPSSHTLGSSPDVLFSPLSPASVQTAASSPEYKHTGHEDDFIDTILQTGGMSSPFNTASDSSLDRLSPSSPVSSPSPPQFQLMLSPPAAPSCDTPPPSLSACPELHAAVATAGEGRHSCDTGSGRLEDFLESTTGKPLLGVEPGGLLMLIDDLHSQMLCTPSILDNPPSPMDTFDMAPEEVRGLDSMDWLDLTVGEETTSASLGPQTPASIFSTDFLDSCDLQIHWDSCQ